MLTRQVAGWEPRGLIRIKRCLCVFVNHLSIGEFSLTGNIAGLKMLKELLLMRSNVLKLRPAVAVYAGIILLALHAQPARGQQVVEKTLVTVSDGVRTELILLSDVMWQLALQPGVPLDPPCKEDMERALKTLVDQRIFALEAERLPRPGPSDDEVKAKIRELLGYFPTPADFEKRLKAVGFRSVNDEEFERVIARRIAIDSYVAFRFRSFVVVTADEESRYFRDVFVPDFRRRYPGVLMPTLNEKRDEIRRLLIEEKVAARIENFLDDAKRRVDVEYLLEL